jgi:hypothetical protein
MRAKFINESLGESYLFGELSELYNIYHDDNGDTIIHIKTGGDFPYKLKQHGEEVSLYQSFSERSYAKPTFKKLKDFNSPDVNKNYEDVYRFIIKRHNKAASYMNYPVINTEKEFYKDFGFSDKQIKKLK